MSKKIAILTGGGDCPGLNAVIRAVARKSFARGDELNGRVPESVRGEAMGWHGSALTAGSSLGPPVVGMILDAYGWRAGFLMSGAVGLAVVAAIVVLATTRVRRRRAARRATR